MLTPPVCPHGRHFYTCSNLIDVFVGCCNIPECSDGMDGCPNGDLEPASIADSHSEGPAQVCHACLNATLLSSTVPYKSDPCSKGCSRENLTLAIVTYDSNDTRISFSASGASLSSTASTSSPSSTGTSLCTSTSVSSNTPAVDGAGQSALRTGIAAPKTAYALAPKSNPTAIAGGVAGGIVGLALFVGLLAICCRRRHTRPQHDMDEGRSLASGSAQPNSTQPDNAELEVIKQGASSTSSPLRPPSPPLSPLPSPLPPPPAYTAYRPQGNELDRSPDYSHRSSGSPYVSSDLASPELPPSPPPLENRISQRSVDSYSDGQSVSPISSHYQHQPFDTSRSLESSAYTEVSREPHHIHGMRS